MSKIPAQPSPVKEAYHFAPDKPWDRFDEEVQNAAKAGKIKNAEPLLRELNSSMRAFSGLDVLLNIINSNYVLADQFDAEDPSSIRPLSPASISSLLGLASEMCRDRSFEICSLADWTEKHIATKEGKA